MDYTKEEVIAKLISLNKDPRKLRDLVDQRSYLITILYYKFGLTEEIIGSYCNRNHSSINHNKKRVCDLFAVKDKSFMHNIRDLYEEFPCDFSVPEAVANRSRIPKTFKVSFVFSEYKKAQLASYMAYKGLDSEQEAIQDLIVKALYLWGK